MTKEKQDAILVADEFQAALMASFMVFSNGINWMICGG